MNYLCLAHHFLSLLQPAPIEDTWKISMSYLGNPPEEGNVLIRAHTYYLQLVRFSSNLLFCLWYTKYGPMLEWFKSTIFYKTALLQNRIVIKIVPRIDCKSLLQVLINTLPCKMWTNFCVHIPQLKSSFSYINTRKKLHGKEGKLYASSESWLLEGSDGRLSKEERLTIYKCGIQLNRSPYNIHNVVNI